MEKQIKVQSIIVKSKNLLIEQKTNRFNYEKGKWYIDTNDLPEILHIEVWFEKNAYNINRLTFRPNGNEWRVTDGSPRFTGFIYRGEKDFLQELEDYVNYELNRK